MHYVDRKPACTYNYMLDGWLHDAVQSPCVRPLSLAFHHFDGIIDL